MHPQIELKLQNLGLAYGGEFFSLSLLELLHLLDVVINTTYFIQEKEVLIHHYYFLTT